MDRLVNSNASHTHILQEQMADRKGIVACGCGFTVAVAEDGGLRYAGDNRYEQSQCISWKDMIGVFAGPDYVLGLGRDGTVAGAGRNAHGQLNVSHWAGVRLIACGATHAVALMENGRVLCTAEEGTYAATASWTDVVDICCGVDFTVGLRRDGRILAVGGARSLRRKLSRWHDVIGVFSNFDGTHVYGITVEGRLLSTRALPASVRAWRDLVSVAATDGTVCGVTRHGEFLPRQFGHVPSDVRDPWTENHHLAVAVGDHHTACLQQNGTLLGRGKNDFGQTEIDWWIPLFDDFDAFVDARRINPAQVAARDRSYQQRFTEAQRYGYRLACGERMTACLAVDGRVNVTAPFGGVKHWEQVRAIACGGSHILALHRDGHVSADGNNVQDCCRVDGWTHIKDIWAGKYYSLGLTEDGHMLFTGWDRYGQGAVTLWKDISRFRATETYVVGMDRSGHLHAVGGQLPFDPAIFQTDAWQGLADISLSDHHIAGLSKDGRVFFEGDGFCGNIDRIKEDVSEWRGVRMLASGNGFVVGLCYGGHVVATGRNHVGQCMTDTWRQIVAIGCGYAYTAALTVDGTVLTAGRQRYRDRTDRHSFSEPSTATREREDQADYAPCRTEGWHQILTMACGMHHLVAVDRHGHVFASGMDRDRQCTVAASFTPFREVRQLDDYGKYLTVKAMDT